MQFAHGDLLKLLLSCSVFWPAPVGNKCAEIWRSMLIINILMEKSLQKDWVF